MKQKTYIVVYAEKKVHATLPEAITSAQALTARAMSLNTSRWQRHPAVSGVIEIYELGNMVARVLPVKAIPASTTVEFITPVRQPRIPTARSGKGKKRS